MTPRTVHTQNRFFGRSQEREQIPRLLKQNRLVTLLGPGGTGKTRLLQELRGEMPEAHLILLSTLSSGAAIPSAIVAALDLPDSNEPALARLQAAFAPKETLLMLDNLEQLVASGGPEAVAELLETIPTLRCLITSRIKLNLPQECVCMLAPLPEDDAIALFVNRASLARASFTHTDENREAVAELCRRLDGLPLAIELAASRAAIITPTQILDRLNRRFDLLADRRRDREERHASLRATLDWGWVLLAPDVQRFFAQLCVFRGSFSLDAAEAVTGEFLAIDYLQYLADASFLIVESPDGHPRFRLLETLREYGQEKWDAADQTLPLRHAAFFLEQARQWSTQFKAVGFAETMTLFKQDHDNFVAALDTSLSSDPLQALELCQQLASFWHNAYRKRELLNYLSRTVSAVQAAGLSDQRTSQQWATVHDNLATTYRSIQDYSRAHQHFQEALAYHDKELRATTGEAHRAAQRSRAGTLHNLANNLYYEKRFVEAHRCYAEAAALNREIGNTAWLANNLNGLCHICGIQASDPENRDQRTALFEQGLAYIQEAVAICRANSQDYFLCFMLDVQGNMLLGLEREDDALTVLAEGFALASRVENWEVLSEVLLQYHHLAFQDKHWDVAAQFLGSASGIARRWEIDIYAAQMPHLTITESRQKTLIEALGVERYDALYQAGYQSGFHTSPDALQTLVSTMHPSSKI